MANPLTLASSIVAITLITIVAIYRSPGYINMIISKLIHHLAHSLQRNDRLYHICHRHSLRDERFSTSDCGGIMDLVEHRDSVTGW